MDTGAPSARRGGAPAAACLAPPTLRPMELTDIPFAVHLHTRHLHRGFFVELGPRFLAHYYRTFLTSAAGVALVAEADGAPVGFLAGSIDRDAHRRHYARLDRVRLARAGTVALAARPALMERFVRTRARRYAGRLVARPPSAHPSERAGMLHHIAVAEGSRRTGAGRRLVQGFTEIARLQGTRRLSLYTEHGDTRAHAFYGGLGWTELPPVHDVDGRLWSRFVQDL